MKIFSSIFFNNQLNSYCINNVIPSKIIKDDNGNIINVPEEVNLEKVKYFLPVHQQYALIYKLNINNVNGSDQFTCYQKINELNDTMYNRYSFYMDSITKLLLRQMNIPSYYLETSSKENVYNFLKFINMIDSCNLNLVNCFIGYALTDTDVILSNYYVLHADTLQQLNQFKLNEYYNFYFDKYNQVTKKQIMLSDEVISKLNYEINTDHLDKKIEEFNRLNSKFTTKSKLLFFNSKDEYYEADWNYFMPIIQKSKELFKL